MFFTGSIAADKMPPPPPPLSSSLLLLPSLTLSNGCLCIHTDTPLRFTLHPENSQLSLLHQHRNKWGLKNAISNGYGTCHTIPYRAVASCTQSRTNREIIASNRERIHGNSGAPTRRLTQTRSNTLAELARVYRILKF